LKRFALVFPVLLFILAACQPVGLPKGKVYFGKTKLTVEIADTTERQRIGLMFRKYLPEDQGMLFDFKQPAIQHFWMKDTPISLSIAFLSETGEVLRITDMVAYDDQHIHASPDGTRFALEVNRGWFQKKGIQVGDQAVIEGISDYEMPSVPYAR
jgi:hypothetical protein